MLKELSLDNCDWVHNVHKVGLHDGRSPEVNKQQIDTEDSCRQGWFGHRHRDVLEKGVFDFGKCGHTAFISICGDVAVLVHGVCRHVD